MKKHAFHATILLFLLTLTQLFSLSSALGAPGDFLFEWGQKYNFNRPVGVAVDGSGNLYVVDAGNSLVQVFDSKGAFLRRWGSSGFGDGQFRNPYGIAVDGSGNVYVADTGNCRIQVFDSKGVFLRKWGGYGSGDGQFYNPNGVAVDRSGYIYVADTDNRRIQVFEGNGTFLRKWGSYGSGEGQFINPRAVAVAGSGKVYVTDYSNSNIQVFDSTGVFLQKWGNYGPENGQFYYPNGVTVDSTGNVYVADYYSGRIQVFDSTGVFLRKWGSAGSGDGQFSYLVGLAVDGSGNVYTAEYKNRRVQAFNDQGAFVWKLESYGTSDGLFNFPYGVAVNGSGDVFVTEYGNRRIQVFNSTGAFLRKWGYGYGNSPLVRFTGVAVDGSNKVYAAYFDYYNFDIQLYNYGIKVFDSWGGYQWKWWNYLYGDSPNSTFIGVAYAGEYNIFAADPNNHRIQGSYLIPKIGSYGFGDGQFRWPQGVAVDSGGNIYVADSGNHRIQVFNSFGVFLRKWGSYGSGDGQFSYPHALAIDGNDTVYVSDASNRIQVFDSTGTFLTKCGISSGYSYGIAVNRSGTKVYVADSNNNRIQVFEGYGSGTRDIDKPVTTAAATGTKGNSDWYVSDVTVTLTATDTGSGVKEIHYALDGGADTVISGSSASISVGTDGTHAITYYATDNAGNIELPSSVSFKIDKTPPAITITGVQDGATYALGLVPTAAYTAADATSGLAASSSSLTGGDGLGLGTFTYAVTASDNAGNVATVPAVYQVIATPDGLLALIGQMLAAGLIDNEGIANSLTAKVANAQNAANDQAADNIMQAFINQVEAQAGQHIAQDAAAVLINAANYIIGH